jgi:hypothetical protein
MSADAREKARKHGQRSEKGRRILSRLLGRVDDEDE